MENKILEVIHDLNIKRLEAEEEGREEHAQKLLTLSQGLKELYL